MVMMIYLILLIIINRIEHLTMYADKEAVIEAIDKFLIWYEQNK